MRAMFVTTINKQTKNKQTKNNIAIEYFQI